METSYHRSILARTTGMSSERESSLALVLGLYGRDSRMPLESSHANSLPLADILPGLAVLRRQLSEVASSSSLEMGLELAPENKPQVFRRVGDPLANLRLEFSDDLETDHEAGHFATLSDDEKLTDNRARRLRKLVRRSLIDYRNQHKS